MIRFVAGPGGVVVPDLAEKLPGRGMWLTAGPEHFAAARKKRAFARGARAPVTVPDDLEDQVETLLLRRVQDMLALARKAGLTHMGFDTVKGRLKAGPVAALIEASDGSEPQRAKLRPMAGDAPVLNALDRQELGLAFGRDNVIHAALDAGGLTDQVLREVSRLSAMRDLQVVAGADKRPATE